MIKKILIGAGIVLIFFILIVIFRKNKAFPAQGRGVSGNSGGSGGSGGSTKDIDFTRVLRYKELNNLGGMFEGGTATLI